MTQLRAASLAWALKHVMRDGDTDVFPSPFEFKIIRKNKATLLPVLRSRALEHYTWEGPRRMMVPKADYAFRPVCQLDPLDSIYFAGIIKEIGTKIERRRAREDSKVAFSYRFNPSPNGQLYNPVSGWEGFWQESKHLCQSHSHLLVTDLSDFYNQIYHHTIENQLLKCNIATPYITAIKKLLANTSEGVSRGLPIGPHPSHLLAEMSLIPVDEYLSGLRVRFCRYVDDIHIFCESRDHAQRVLCELVDYLDKTHKLQINKQKTKIYNSEQFRPICTDNAVDKPISDLENRLLTAVRSHTRSPYERIRIDVLSIADLDVLSQANIESVLHDYIRQPEVDYIRLRWFLRRLSQVGTPGGVRFIVKNFSEFLPAIADAARYFASCTDNYSGTWADVGSDLLRIYNTGLVQASEYLQVIILSLFSNIEGMNHIDDLTSIYNTSSDMCKRKILLAAAESKASAWLSSHKGTYKSADRWTKRAAIHSMRALPADERNFWLRSAKGRLDGLDLAIAESVAA